jgi:N-methylhydantoinase A
LFRVSVDVGGTFTDLVALDEETGAVENIKVLSVPRNPEKGVTDALARWLEGHSANQVRLIGHATTIATNALLGQVDLEVPKVALVTTRGFGRPRDWAPAPRWRSTTSSSTAPQLLSEASGSSG